jgi:hypothetical protein
LGRGWFPFIHCRETCTDGIGEALHFNGIGAKIVHDENIGWGEKQERRGFSEDAEVTMGEEKCWGGGGNREVLARMGLSWQASKPASIREK